MKNQISKIAQICFFFLFLSSFYIIHNIDIIVASEYNVNNPSIKCLRIKIDNLIIKHSIPGASIAIISKDNTKPAIILEIKSVSQPKVPKKNLPKVLEALLTREAKKALEQINRNQYMVELVQRGITNIVKIGLAFSGKEFSVVSERGKEEEGSKRLAQQASKDFF